MRLRVTLQYHNYSSMCKTVLTLSFLVLMISCSPYEETKLNFVDGEAVVHLKSQKKGLTTMCKISLVGESECDLKLFISGTGPVCISGGRINYWRNYEWFDEERKISVVLRNECRGQPNLILGYEFSARYFGKGMASEKVDCNN